jgi:hypothetical protein
MQFLLDWISRQYLCVVMVGQPGATFPASTPLLKSNAKKCEALRMRCLDRRCPLRSTDEVKNMEDEGMKVDPGRG